MMRICVYVQFGQWHFRCCCNRIHFSSLLRCLTYPAAYMACFTGVIGGKDKVEIQLLRVWSKLSRSSPSSTDIILYKRQSMTDWRCETSSPFWTLPRKPELNLLSFFNLWWDLNPWPLRYRCSVLPTELTSQLGAGDLLLWKIVTEVNATLGVAKRKPKSFAFAKH